MKKLEKKNGITLISLVITIVILLILAGISISALTNTGIFAKVKEAKEKSNNFEKEQSKILDAYENEMNQYDQNTILYKVKNGEIKIGDYIAYIPNIISNTDTGYTTLISNLETYSGSDENNTSTRKQENLNWRVLDVKDGQVRLISGKPTEVTITLKGYNGYNNSVKLLDDSCSVLYGNSEFASKVQNLKIEDIQEKMKKTENIDDNYNEKFDIDTDKFYPEILKKEKGQKIDEIEGNELEISEQNFFIAQEGNMEANKLSLKYTYYSKEIKNTDFYNNKYYELFIKTQDKYFSYFMSSRCVGVSSGRGCFFIRNINSGKIDAANCSYFSNNYQNIDKDSFRPIVTLNSNVQIDLNNSGDGSTEENAYVIK